MPCARNWSSTVKCSPCSNTSSSRLSPAARMRFINRSRRSRRKRPAFNRPAPTARNAAANWQYRCGRTKETTFAELNPLLPAECRPLVVALVEENNELLVRVRQRVRQNHLLLSRSIELMQGLINSLFPSREPRVYNGRGTTKTRRAMQRWTYEAVG